MNDNENKAVQDAGKTLQKAFPEFHGKIQFNLKPGRKEVVVNVEQSHIYQEN